ncbi:GGDEF domain-containing protein [Viridibacillus arvi]|uniref:GGDEF domain-containing protein n=1 Tax=Viridibacillus arvi TaxID=263475 RepID=UPI003D2E438F
MNLTINISLLALLVIPIIFLMLTTLAFMVSRLTNIKRDLNLSLAFFLIGIFSIINFTCIGEIKILFWGTPYHVASICLVLQVVATMYFSRKQSKTELISISVVGILLLVSFLLNGFVAGQIVFLSFLIYGSWGTYKVYKGNSKFKLRGTMFILLAILLFVGQWFPFFSGIFLFSVVIIIAMLVESQYYFVRVVSMLRNAGINSIIDPLTTLYNKGFLLRKTDQLIKNNSPVEIIFSDIDNFKTLNDTKGHEYGDKILIQVGALLKEELEEKGYACRFGGEELVGIVIKGDGVKIAEQLRKRVEAQTGVTLSIGVASTNDIIGEVNSAALIKRADERMYIAKTSGKNKVVSLTI